MTGLAMLAALGTTQVAHAEVPANEFLSRYHSASDKGKAELRLYMTGLVTAYGYANTALKAQGAMPLYCVPKGTDLGDEEVIGLMRQTIKRDSQIGRTPFGMGLLVALDRRFPCKSKKEDKNLDK
jgi:hypothetical protein